MAKPINYVTELTEQEAREFIKAEKREPGESTKNLFKEAKKISGEVRKLFKT